MLIGAASVLRSRRTTGDYYMASKAVRPWLAGLSAVATNNSGYMFIGMIGLTWQTGWSSIWLMIGWILGDLCGSLLVMRQVRAASRQAGVQSYPQLLSRWQGGDQRHVRRIAALLVILFLGTYAAAQLKAGSKALHVIFDWDMAVGVLLGALVVLIYSIAGGIRAAIWTDAAQSFVMLAAMFVLMVVGIHFLGGIEPVWHALHAVGPGYMDWFPAPTAMEQTMVILGWLFAGMAVIGQPQVVIRFMAVDDERHVRHARFWYYGWFTTFYALTIVVGLLTRLILPEAGFDPELALPRMAVELLPGVLVGGVLAGLFAATISTADSLVLVCSSALADDLPGEQPRLRTAKLATAAVVLLAAAIALEDNQTVFELVLMAWGLLGAAFAPLILVLARGGHPRQLESVFIMVTGVTVFLVWRETGLGARIYEVLPGILAGLVAWPIARGLRRVPGSGAGRA